MREDTTGKRSPNSHQNAIISQHAIQPIPEENLVNEVRGMYAGLVMVEKKCLKIHHPSRLSSDLSSTPWQALIRLHRTLLHEHHDFLLASQHPSPGPTLRHLTVKYSTHSTPERMGRHGIHSFLEILRQRLPTSMDHMLSFIHVAYCFMSSPIELAPVFEDTWIECLGDGARCRMVIEDIENSDREYRKADGRTERVRHHLAVLARPNIPQQLPRNIISYFPFSSNLITDPEPYQRSNIYLPEDYHPSGLLWVSLTNSTSEAWMDHDMDLEYDVCYTIKSCHSRAVLDRFPTLLEFHPRFVFIKSDKAHDGVGTVHKSISHSRKAIASAMVRLPIRLKSVSFLTFSMLFLSYSSALPINQDEKIEGKDNDSCTLRADDIALLSFSVLCIPVCFLLGQKLGQPRTFGTLMVVFNIVNLLTSGDPLVSRVGHWVYFRRTVGKTLSPHYAEFWSSGPSGSRGENPDSASQYLLSSLAFTLICWWKIAEWSVPISSTKGLYLNLGYTLTSSALVPTKISTCNYIMAHQAHNLPWNTLAAKFKYMPKNPRYQWKTNIYPSQARPSRATDLLCQCLRTNHRGFSASERAKYPHSCPRRPIRVHAHRHAAKDRAHAAEIPQRALRQVDPMGDECRPMSFWARSHDDCDPRLLRNHLRPSACGGELLKMLFLLNEMDVLLRVTLRPGNAQPVADWWSFPYEFPPDYGWPELMCTALMAYICLDVLYVIEERKDCGQFFRTNDWRDNPLYGRASLAMLRQRWPASIHIPSSADLYISLHYLNIKGLPTELGMMVLEFANYEPHHRAIVPDDPLHIEDAPELCKYLGFYWQLLVRCDVLAAKAYGKRVDWIVGLMTSLGIGKGMRLRDAA
ncbi:hypothetical protein BDBG_03268 [Blastomyces gilchristii SLH14081]|uniref:Uncharacterized protein n=1 Tax=Blastomyces gilchristii (strain SLH14081) TaxID=559298 RepID=A0A179UL94_BLAGS|nr:uncharacterized protein BDBG_03268 [Blastomyces gilchristii SLH14081]OAT07172.1 hypothetical protein BDBG_03268 [Blastomyces gilchristii SLH14081]